MKKFITQTFRRLLFMAIVLVVTSMHPTLAGGIQVKIVTSEERQRIAVMKHLQKLSEHDSSK